MVTGSAEIDEYTSSHDMLHTDYDIYPPTPANRREVSFRMDARAKELVLQAHSTLPNQNDPQDQEREDTNLLNERELVNEYMSSHDWLNTWTRHIPTHTSRAKTLQLHGCHPFHRM